MPASTITISDWLICLATLLGPILAVQAQKLIERTRADRATRLGIFKSLMATRGNTLSPEHVQALNMIDLEFAGQSFQAVRAAWRSYFDHLSNVPVGDDVRMAAWGERRVDLLSVLLVEMGKKVGHKFHEVEIKRGIYAPQGHFDREQEETAVRRGLLALLAAQAHLKMEVDIKSNPAISSEMAQYQEDLRKVLMDVLTGKQHLAIHSE